jgi:hypothetical protein
VSQYPSLTKADVKALTPDELVNLAAIGYGEAHMLYRQALLGRLSGVRESSLYDLLLSRVKKVKRSEFAIQGRGGRSFFAPWILEEREDNINITSFAITAGIANPDAGTTVGGIAYHAGSWKITVANSSSPYATQVNQPHRYFLKGEHIIVLNLSSEGAAQNPVFVVENAVNNDGTTGFVFIRPLFTTAGWNALTSDQKAVYQPTLGVAQLGANSVSDYESWCENQPVELSRRMVYHWLQTMRFTRTWDDEMEKYLDYIFAGNVNPYLDRFRELPMSEQNKRQFALYQRKLMATLFWGQKIDENQTVEGYQNLPQIVDPRTGTFIEYKTNLEGIYPKLDQGGRVIDYAGAGLDFNVLEEQLYSLKRHREAEGGTVEEIDVMVDRHTANRIKSLMTRYYQAKYGTSWQQHFGSNEAVRFDQNKVLWNRQSYEFDEAHVVLNVLVEEAMSDFRLHFPTQIRSRGNFMWFLDWSDISLATTNSASRTSATPDLATDPEFKCTIKANITRYEMESVTMTPMIGDESRHLVLTNFSDDCPRYAVQTCEPTTTS